MVLFLIRTKRLSFLLSSRYNETPRPDSRETPWGRWWCSLHLYVRRRALLLLQLVPPLTRRQPESLRLSGSIREAEINCFYFKGNQRVSEREWKPGSRTLKASRGVRSHTEMVSASSAVSGGSEAPAVLPTLSSSLSFSPSELKHSGCFGSAAAARGLAGAEMRRVASRMRARRWS